MSTTVFNNGFSMSLSIREGENMRVWEYGDEDSRYRRGESRDKILINVIMNMIIVHTEDRFTVLHRTAYCTGVCD
jgi:hypothetical protein